MIAKRIRTPSRGEIQDMAEKIRRFANNGIGYSLCFDVKYNMYVFLEESENINTKSYLYYAIGRISGENISKMKEWDILPYWDTDLIAQCLNNWFGKMVYIELPPNVCSRCYKRLMATDTYTEMSPSEDGLIKVCGDCSKDRSGEDVEES